MLVVITIVFIAVFTLVLLLTSAFGSGASEEKKRTLAMLDTALATQADSTPDEIIDIRRQEYL